MTQSATEMRRTYLVQRLNPPRPAGPLGGLVESFSFGGGLKNGGLSENAMSILRPIFSFDYMGAAEFEFGAVPKALSAIAEAAGRKGRGLAAFSFEIPLSEVAPHWSDKSKTAPDGDATLYVLCPKAWAVEVESRIRRMAAEPFGGYKETPLLADVLRPSDRYAPDVAGWLELDNGFMFFTDRTMWESTCAVFSVKAPEAVSR